MKKEYGPYYRIGAQGGPGCPVSVLPINIENPTGSPVNAELLDAGSDTSEIELLRTVASRLGVQWGRDEHGWWAVVHGEGFPSWSVWRQDDNGNQFLVEANLSESDAKRKTKEFEATGHKQTYWAKNEIEL